jgi:hypothetical protein
VHGQAYRTAWSENLTGEAFKNRVIDITTNPKAHGNIHFDSIDFARYATFNKPLNMAGRNLQTAVRLFPPARVILPFLRTPIDVMKFVGEHSPLAAMSGKIKAEIAAGGARRDLALAKIATGSTIMAVTADLAMSGIITGRGPEDPTLYARKWETGWRPYSVKIGDRYHPYDRLDPLGATLGIAADLALILGQIDEHDAHNVAGAAVLSIAQNIMSKTYMRGLSDFVEFITQSKPDPEEPFKRSGDYVARMLGTLVPFSSGVAAVERAVHPGVSSAYTMIEKIMSRLPGLSSTLPPARNIFGEPIELSDGLGLDIISPVYSSYDKKDSVADEIVKQQTRIRMPSRIVDGIKLDTKEYDKYVLLYSGKNNPYVKMPLKEALRRRIASGEYKYATDGPDGGKSEMLKVIFEDYRAAAKKALKDQLRSVGTRVKIEQRKKARALGVGQ